MFYRTCTRCYCYQFFFANDGGQNKLVRLSLEIVFRARSLPKEKDFCQIFNLMKLFLLRPRCLFHGILTEGEGSLDGPPCTNKFWSAAFITKKKYFSIIQNNLFSWGGEQYWACGSLGLFVTYKWSVMNTK